MKFSIFIYLFDQNFNLAFVLNCILKNRYIVPSQFFLNFNLAFVLNCIRKNRYIVSDVYPLLLSPFFDQ